MTNQTIKTRRHLSASFFIVSLLLLAGLLLGFTETDDFFRYDLLENGNVVIVGYEGFSHTLHIPGELDGHPVEAIGTTAFYRNEYIRNITIDGRITRIEKDAFGDCPNLNRVVIEEGASKTVGEAAFAGCLLLKKLSIGNGVTLLDDFAFENCVRLQAVQIPATVSQIGYHCFAGCESLVMDTSLSGIAVSYAAENHIDTGFTQSNRFLWLEIGGGTILGLAVVGLVWIILKKRRK